MDILKSCFGDKNIFTLNEFIVRKRADDSPSLKKDVTFTTFLNSIIVCIPSPDPVQRQSSFSLEASQRTVIEQVTTMLLSSGVDKRNFVLTMGLNRFKKVEYPNSIKMHLESTLWCKLLTHIGDELMRQLLLRCSVFEPVLNGSFVQLSGPILYALRKASLKTRTQNKSSPKLLRLMDSLYSETQFGVIGLPKKHIMNQLAPNQYQFELKHRTSPSFNSAMRLVRYIFQRDTNRNGTAVTSYRQKSRHRRSQLRPNHFCKTLRQLIPSFQNMLRRHQNMNYEKHMRVYCPLPDFFRHPNASLAGVRLATQTFDDMQSFTDSTITDDVTAVASTLPNTNSSNNQFNHVNIGEQTDFVPSPLEGHCVDLLKFDVKPQQIAQYLRVVIMRVVPARLLGSKQNFARICAMVHKLLRMRKFESFTLHNLIQGFHWTDCTWLNYSSANPHTRKHRLDLLTQFLRWLFCEFIIPLLRNCFYCTDKEQFKHKIFFYRRPVWRRIQKLALNSELAHQFEPLSHSNAYKILLERFNGPYNFKIGFSSMRLLPKATGVRAIINCSKPRFIRSSSENSNGILQFLAVNSSLKKVFYSLLRATVCEPNVLGASIKGLNGMYEKLLSVSLRFRELCRVAEANHHDKPHLYFVSVDIKQCFDSINRCRGMKIWEKVLSQGDYLIKRWVRLQHGKHGVWPRFECRAIGYEQLHDFCVFAQRESAQWSSVVFTDQVALDIWSSDVLKKLLKRHVFENIVVMENSFYQQKKGIPQGSMLSSLLCNLYFAEIERSQIRPALLAAMNERDDGKTWPWQRDGRIGTLMRQVDDFLLVTTCERTARAFRDVMHIGFPQQGCSVNTSKTRTNLSDGFDTRDCSMSHRISSRNISQRLRWCGIKFDTSALNIYADYSRFTTLISDSMTVQHSGNEGKRILASIRLMITPKTHPLLLDARINDTKTVVVNVYEIFHFAAIKLFSRLREMRTPSFVFMADIFEEALSKFHWLRSRRIKTISGAKFPLDIRETRLLALRAFLVVFRRKRSKYQLFLHSVRKELARHSNRVLMAREHIRNQLGTNLSQSVYDMLY